jgi:hypothetical protein
MAGEPETGQIAVHKAVSWPNHLVRWQCYCLSTNTRMGCWRSNTRTTKIEMSLFLDLKFSFFIVLCIFFIFLNIFFFFSLPTPELDAEGVTTELLRLKLYCIWTWDFFFLLFLSYFSFFSYSLNACFVHCWLVCYHSINFFSSFFSFFFSLYAFFSFLLFHSRYHYLY